MKVNHIKSFAHLIALETKRDRSRASEQRANSRAHCGPSTQPPGGCEDALRGLPYPEGMARRTNKRGLRPVHPGELLAEVVVPALEEMGATRKEIAHRLGVSTDDMTDLLQQKLRVDKRLAHALARLCGNSATIWLNLQRAYDVGLRRWVRARRTFSRVHQPTRRRRRRA
ncbi:MAG: HigA family addiction module antitoxin [Caulobacterales bacterium]